jgi:hypothetical protein
MREMKDTPKGLRVLHMKGGETGQKVLRNTSKIGCMGGSCSNEILKR